MKKLLLTLLVGALALPSFARDFEYTYEGQTLTYTVNFEDPRTVSTKGGGYYSPGNDVSGNLIIPSTVENEGVSYTVTSIGDYAFYRCSGLTSITIPNSVTSIGEFAFAHCKGLTSVTVPNSVTVIGYAAFGWCDAMTSVTIGNSVTKIGQSAFGSCTGLTSVTIPNSVTKIDNWAFGGCSGLTSVTIPNSVAEIGGFAFDGCTGLTSVIIGNSVTEIGGYAFYECTGLTSVTYLAENPIQSSSNIFPKKTYENATLNYLNVAEEKIAATEPWNKFINRVGQEAAPEGSIL